MKSEDVLVPGARDVRATLDAPDGAGETPATNADLASRPDACVVACPPHPRHRGHRGDPRLTAVSEALVSGVASHETDSNERQRREPGVACLRFDYGEWDEGYGEREDARNAVRWAADRFERVGLFGYSFGGAVALLAAASVDREVAAVSALAPAPRLTDDLDAVAALDDLVCPVQVLYGVRDELVDWEPVVERAEELGHDTVELSSDHHFVGQHETVADAVAAFLGARL